MRVFLGGIERISCLNKGSRKGLSLGNPCVLFKDRLKSGDETTSMAYNNTRIFSCGRPPRKYFSELVDSKSEFCFLHESSNGARKSHDAFSFYGGADHRGRAYLYM